MKPHPSVKHPENLLLSINLALKIQEEELPFSVAYFYERIREGTRPKIDSGRLEHNCGFVACIGGYMMIDPAHQERGFKPNNPVVMEPQFGEDFGFMAMSNFWGVDYDHARAVGMDSFYFPKNPSIKIVRERMEHLYVHGKAMSNEEIERVFGDKSMFA